MRKQLPIISCAQALVLAQKSRDHHALALDHFATAVEWASADPEISGQHYSRYRRYLRAARLLERTIIQCANLTIGCNRIEGRDLTD